jgi:hypothetical protein
MMKKIDILKYITESFEETKEAMGASSAGGFEGPAFSMWSDDEEEVKKEYKKTEGEFKEATSSSSVGAYDAPGFEDVNMKGNHPKGSGKSFKKPQFKGGEFVKLKDSCTKYNNKKWCSQGDSKDKPVSTSKTLSPFNEAIHNVSLRTGLSEERIKNIILSTIDNNL